MHLLDVLLWGEGAGDVCSEKTMTEDELKGIELAPTLDDVPALVAEVRKLRALLAEHQECGYSGYLDGSPECKHCLGGYDGHSDDCELANAFGLPKQWPRVIPKPR